MAAILLAYLLLKPINNWDIIGYLAGLFWLEGYSPNDIHSMTYGALKAAVTASRYEMLTSAGAYHSAIFADPAALMAQIPFYATRILQLILAQGLAWLGVAPISALHVINGLAITLSWLLLAHWLKPTKSSHWALLLLIFVLSGAISIGRSVTPDALTTLVALLAFLACLQRHTLAWLAVLILPLVRTDYVILAGLLCLWQLWQTRQWRWVFIAMLSGVVMLAVNHWAGHYGYRIIMQFTLLDAAPFPQVMPITWGMREYPGFIVSGLRELASGTAIWLVLFSGAFVMLSKGRMSDESRCILGLIAAFFIVHFLVFPAGFQRFYVPCTLIVMGLLWRAMATSHQFTVVDAEARS